MCGHLYWCSDILSASVWSSVFAFTLYLSSCARTQLRLRTYLKSHCICASAVIEICNCKYWRSNSIFDTDPRWNTCNDPLARYSCILFFKHYLNIKYYSNKRCNEYVIPIQYVMLLLTNCIMLYSIYGQKSSPKKKHEPLRMIMELEFFFIMYIYILYL